MPDARVIKAFTEGLHEPLDPVEVAIGVTGTLLLRRNPNRTQVVIVNGAAGAGAVRARGPPASITAGTRIEANGIQVYRVDRDGDAVGSEWYAIAPGGAGTFTVTEWVARA